MVKTRSNDACSAATKAPSSNLDSISDDEDAFEDISHYLDGMKKAVARVKKEMTSLQEKKRELEEELAEEKEAADLASTRRRRTANTPAIVAQLEDEVKRLKSENRKKDKIIEKMKEQEVEEDARDLMDTVPDPETGIDESSRMRKLLRRFSDLMLVTTLGEGDECAICFETMELEKCSAFQCGHLLCNNCLKEILPRDEQFQCPMCRQFTDRESIELVHMSEVDRWDELLKVANAWDAADHRPVVDTSEEELEETFVTDNSGEGTNASDEEAETADGDSDGRQLGDDQQEESETQSSTPPPQLSYAESPMKVKRKRLEQLAEERLRERKRRR